MRTYHIDVPVVMRLSVGIKANSEEEAKEKLFNADIALDVTNGRSEFDYIDYEWEMHEKVVQGNVYYGSINNMDITEMGEE